MNPLSTFTYYLRHKGQAALLLSLVTLTTLGLCLMAAVLDSITLMNAEISYLKYVSQIIPNVGTSFEAGVISQIQANPDVERVILENGLWIDQPTLLDQYSVDLLGISQEDLEYLIEHLNMRVKEGRLLLPRTNEIMLTEEVARALGLQLGDQIAQSIDPEAYSAILTPLVLVGILEADPSVLPGAEPNVRVGLASYEYFNSHEVYEYQFIRMLVVAREGRKQAVDEFLETEIASPHIIVDTHKREQELFIQDWQEVMVAYGIINLVVAIGAAIVVGVVNQIAITQRLPELGMLNALGYHKKQLIRRLALETAVVSVLSWIFGLVLAFVILVWLKNGLYYAKGVELNLRSLTPLWLTVPLPLTVIFLSAIGIIRAFAKFDAVAIVERGKLTLEAQQRVSGSPSSSGAISALTFHLRHRRRGIILLVSTVLAILIITIPVFINIAIINAMKPNLEYLRYVSEVWPSGDQVVDAGLLAQIRGQPTVERVIPTISTDLEISVPLGDRVATNVYGITENDLPYLLDSLGVQVKEGRLLSARTNEIVIAETVAVNRGLHVGDTISLPYHIPSQFELFISSSDTVEMVIVGILGREEEQLGAGQASPDDMWLNFASYEFMGNYESTSFRAVHWFVVPVPGRMSEMEAWLEQNVASEQTQVTTYTTQYREVEERLREPILVFAAIEISIVVITAIAVGIMNYITFTQRHEEFGILNALGYRRLWLVLRTAGEMASVVAIAWLISAVIYEVGLLLTQAAVFAPKGIPLNTFDPIPWLFSFPVPLTIIVASAGVVARMLSRLDPVSIIERR